MLAILGLLVILYGVYKFTRRKKISKEMEKAQAMQFTQEKYQPMIEEEVDPPEIVLAENEDGGETTLPKQETEETEETEELQS